MRDNKLREFLGVIECDRFLTAPTSVNRKHLGILVHLRDRIESLERYLEIKYESGPSVKDYPKHTKI